MRDGRARYTLVEGNVNRTNGHNWGRKRRKKNTEPMNRTSRKMWRAESPSTWQRLQQIGRKRQSLILFQFNKRLDCITWNEKLFCVFLSGSCLFWHAFRMSAIQEAKSALNGKSNETDREWTNKRERQRSSE